MNTEEIDTQSELMSTAECAAFLGVTIATLQQWRTRRTGPPWAKAGVKVIYLRKNVMKWLEKGGDKHENAEK
ncbi:helix-turn-helix domain-containing protein [Mobiluncus mulieris]|uniref:Helix-turn-helix domain-containing protein n=1 Tax=Mobiluncus mulieris TaxID=2052 RepID=A0A7Y0U0B8_9ACTO|nr:helix-turn-helix domain-containing protein [Mobiluncus mulieris]NMW64616.1 helix-turn-helix domain-containing protein [Mobiluncus mulieris]